MLKQFIVTPIITPTNRAVGRYVIGPVYVYRVNLCVWLWAGLLQKSSANFVKTWCYGKNRLISGCDPIQDTDSGSLLRFRQHCSKGHFRRFISISHTVTGRFSWKFVKWLMPSRELIHYIWEQSSHTWIRIHVDWIAPKCSGSRYSEI